MAAAAAAAEKRSQKASPRRKADATSIKQTQAQEAAIQDDRTRITALFSRANTDVELWQTLHTHVLNRVAALGLDETPAAAAAAQAWQKHLQTERDEVRTNSAAPRTPVASVSDLTILTANLPYHLTTFLTQLTTHFPSSAPLGLSLLPTLKKLGPASYALGATTELYNAHMSLLYAKYADVLGVVDVLAEMDREVYAFDDGTLRVLERILGDARRAGRESGEGTRVWWAMERMRRGVKGVVRWRKVVEERRQEEALRAAREAEAKRADQGVEADEQEGVK